MKCSSDSYIVDGQSSGDLVILAHGAGANMSHEFMESMAQGLASAGFQVLRFNFPYMQANLADGKRRPPDRPVKLLAHFETVLLEAYDHFRPKRIFLVGKSMGGRMAAMLSESSELMARTRVAGLVCLGYPFVPLKGGEPRLAPLVKASVPVMILQGARDKFGSQEDMTNWPIPEIIKCHYLPDGDHSFKPRKSSGTDLEANLAQAISHCIEFITLSA